MKPESTIPEWVTEIPGELWEEDPQQAMAVFLCGCAAHLLKTDSGEPLTPSEFQEDILYNIAPVLLEGGRREIILGPPRHGKSTMTTILLAAVYLGLFPSRHVMIISNAGGSAVEFSMAVQKIVESEAYQELFPEAAPDKASGWKSQSWFLSRDTPGDKDPSLAAFGVDGQIIGKGADLIIVDDAATFKNSGTMHQRRKLLNLVRGTILSRLSPNGSVVVTGHRVDPDDLYGSLSSKPDEKRTQWNTRTYRAIKEDGTALDPVRWPVEKLERARVEDVSPTLFECMYQQNPEAMRANAFFRREWILMDADNPPPLDSMEVIVSLDLARSPVGDYFVAGAVGFAVECRHASPWLLGKVRDRDMPIDEQAQAAVDLWTEFRPGGAPPKIAIEDVGYQIVIADRIIAIAPDAADSIVKMPSVSKKTARAYPLQSAASAPQTEGGGIHLRAQDLDVLGELIQFDGSGKNPDDCVDILSQAVRAREGNDGQAGSTAASVSEPGADPKTGRRNRGRSIRRGPRVPY